MKAILFIFLIFFFSLDVISQTIEKEYNSLLKAKVFTYFPQSQQIIFQKIIFDSTKKVEYRVGLIIYRNSINTIEFMKEGSGINFEDNSTITFLEKLYITYLYAGKHEIAIKHSLTESEIEELKNKEIESFRIFEYEKKIDRFLKGEIKKPLINCWPQNKYASFSIKPFEKHSNI